MSSSSDDPCRDPGEETKLRWQKDSETVGAVSRCNPPPWKVGDQLSDFVLERLLGSGSSGVVYRALDVKRNRRCALKLLKEGPPDDLLRNKLGFRRMMMLEHPNLLRVDRIYQLGSCIALSMEEVDGMTLSKAIRRLGRLSFDEACNRLLALLRDFACGLAVMHGHGFVHRDIKPENLMVDREGRGRVIDYGLVDCFEFDQACAGTRGLLVGTPHYFAPEVLWSQQYLPAGDIFSLGIVMLDALRWLQTNVAGGATPSPLAVRRSDTSRSDDAERIDEAIEDLPETVPGIIRDACREMLSRYPAERPTAMQLSRLGAGVTCPIVWPHLQPLVGRDGERQQICDWIDSIFDGDSGRFHLTGDPGIGKSRLIEEAVAYIESKKWGQVFSARCQPRDDQPLEAFDQLCDAIANRYMRGDRERLELDPVSVTILQNAFPVLKNILTCCLRLAPAGTTTERLDALEAAARMSQQLRLVGPLFLVIDDSHWADRDSLNVLDRLQSATGDQGLGIITVSRQTDDPQRAVANQQLALQPLGLEESVQILSRSATRWGRDLSRPMAEQLAAAAGGSPFRLGELADEFRPGGVLAEIHASADASALGQIDQLWRKRAERLSDDAKQLLPFVATAGGRVSTQQLGELTGLGDAVDAAVSELVRQRLVIDEATGGECIMIFHDRVADELVSTLGEKAKRRAHRDWASLLVRQDNPERLAARIASHFFASGQPGRAIAHAILAAEDAERLLAKTEAARWYAQVIEHLEGNEKLSQLRNAARCYREADFPLKAAQYYEQLALLVDEEERIECRQVVVLLLIRGGRFSMACDQLRLWGSEIGLPKTKSRWGNRWALIRRAWQSVLPGRNPPRAGDIASPSTSSPRPADLRAQQRLRLCLSLIKPLSLFDHDYAGQLGRAASKLAHRQGDRAAQLQLAMGRAVLDCRDHGQRRIRGEMALLELKPLVAALNSVRVWGDFWSAIAHSHALACRWDQVPLPVQTCNERYQAAADGLSFDLPHLQWLDLWAGWHLGHWRRLRDRSNLLLGDATRRNDVFQFLMTTGGCGAGWLVQDKLDEWNRFHAEHVRFARDPERVQFIRVLDWVATLQALLYQGRHAEAWSVYRSLDGPLRRRPFASLQLLRVTRRTLGALIGLHHLSSGGGGQWISRIRILTHQLRQEQVSFARVVADLYQGLLEQHIALTLRRAAALQRARHCLRSASAEARARRLRPYYWAAEDALAVLQTGQSLGVLADRMERQQVARPECLQRLYTVPAAPPRSIAGDPDAAAERQ